jgi:excisionase family DNA binding protein
MVADKEILTPTEAAQIIGVKEQTLAKWRQFGRHNLPYIKSGKVIRYRRKDIETWLNAHCVGAEQEA